MLSFNKRVFSANSSLVTDTCSNVRTCVHLSFFNHFRTKKTNFDTKRLEQHFTISVLYLLAISSFTLPTSMLTLNILNYIYQIISIIIKNIKQVFPLEQKNCYALI